LTCRENSGSYRRRVRGKNSFGPWWPERASAVLGGITSVPALGAGFVWDDGSLVESSGLLRGPLWRIWFTASARDYWPLTWTSLWLEWRLWGLEPAGYHATNLALHVAAAVLLWRVLVRLRVPGAWLAAILFVVHPVAVESVAWISERKNTLSAVFFLASILAWLRFEETGRRSAWAGSLGLFGAALLAKSSVVMLPVLLLALAWHRRGRIGKRDLAETAPFFVVALVAGLVTIWFQHHQAMPQDDAATRGLLERMGGAGWAFMTYVRTAIFPVRLGIVYPRWPVEPTSPAFYLPSLLAIAGLAALWWLRAKPGVRAALLGFGYHALMVAPVLGLVDMAYFWFGPVSNHLQYLALMGPSALAGAALARIGARALWPTGLATAGILAALATSTWTRASAFESEATLWRAAVAEQPRSHAAHLQLSQVLLGEGRVADSIAALDRAAAVAPDDATRLWIVLQQQQALGDVPAAAVAARELLPKTRDLDHRRDAAVALLRSGAAGESVEILSENVRQLPASSDYAYWLGVALVRERRLDEAARVLGGFSDARPGHPSIEEALAFVLLKLGRADDALLHAARAAGVDPGEPRAADQLAKWRSQPGW
jgi:protein O-mannosyl-transferase